MTNKTDDQLLHDLRIALTASRGSTGKRLRAALTDLIRSTTARTCLDEAIDRAGRSGNDEVFFELIGARRAIDAAPRADQRSLLEAALPSISWLNTDGNSA